MVALKFLAAGLAGDADLRARFSREVQVLQALDHPAIVRVLDSGEDDGVPWFAMSLVDGPSLRTRLAGGRCPCPRRAPSSRGCCPRWSTRTGAASSTATSSPPTCCWPPRAPSSPTSASPAGRGDGRAETRLTETAAILGTVPYMSPEQRAGAALDRRSDLFSVGVMLYEALTGSLPQGAFAPPSALRPGLTATLDAVVRAAAAAARDRFATAAEAARALDAALAPVRWPRRLALSAAAASVVAGVSGGGWWALRARAGRPSPRRWGRPCLRHLHRHQPAAADAREPPPARTGPASGVDDSPLRDAGVERLEAKDLDAKAFKAKAKLGKARLPGKPSPKSAPAQFFKK